MTARTAGAHAPVRRRVPARRRGGASCPRPARSAAGRPDGSVTGRSTATRIVRRPGRHRDRGQQPRRHAQRRRRPRTSAAARRSTSPGTAPSRPAASSATRTPRDGRNQEYPFVLLQCRGVDTTATVPEGPGRGSRPETCWTQTSAERYLAAASHTPSWRFDAYARPSDRGAVVGAPDPLPEACAAWPQPLTARWLPFRAAGGEVYYGGPDPGVGCTPLAPESDSAEAGGLPSNTTYGITGTDGHGEADFAVWTAAENASLGCSADRRLLAGRRADRRRQLRRLGHQAAGAAQTTKAGVPLDRDAADHGRRRPAARPAPTCPASRGRARRPTRPCAATCGGRRPTGATGSRSR